MSTTDFAAICEECRQRTPDAIVDDHGCTVATGVWTPLNGDDPSVTIGIFTEATDEPPTPVLTLSPAMAVRLARELLGAATAAQSFG